MKETPWKNTEDVQLMFAIKKFFRNIAVRHLEIYLSKEIYLTNFFDCLLNVRGQPGYCDFLPGFLEGSRQRPDCNLNHGVNKQTTHRRHTNNETR